MLVDKNAETTFIMLHSGDYPQEAATLQLRNGNVDPTCMRHFKGEVPRELSNFYYSSYIGIGFSV